MAGRSLCRLPLVVVSVAIVVAGCVSQQPIWDPPNSDNDEFIHFVGMSEGTGAQDIILSQARDSARTEASAYLSAVVSSVVVVSTTNDQTDFHEFITIRTSEIISGLEFTERHIETYRDDARRTVTRVWVVARMIRPEVYWDRETDRLSQEWSSAVASADQSRIFGTADAILNDPLGKADPTNPSLGVRYSALIDQVRAWLSASSGKLHAVGVPSPVTAAEEPDGPVVIRLLADGPISWDEACLVFPNGEIWKTALVTSEAVFTGHSWPATILRPRFAFLVDGEPVVDVPVEIAVRPRRIGVAVSFVGESATGSPPAEMATRVVSAAAGVGQDWLDIELCPGESEGAPCMDLVVGLNSPEQSDGYVRIGMSARLSGGESEVLVDSTTTITGQGRDLPQVLDTLLDHLGIWTVETLISSITDTME